MAEALEIRQSFIGMNLDLLKLHAVEGAAKHSRAMALGALLEISERPHTKDDIEEIFSTMNDPKERKYYRTMLAQA